MLHTVGQLIESSVVADDGMVAQVLDALCDENSWQIRYLLIELPAGCGERVTLFAAESVRGIDVDEGCLLVDRLPVAGAVCVPQLQSLRSLRQMLDCDVAGWTGAIGRTEDVVYDIDSWALRFLLIDAGIWRPDTVVLICPNLIDEAHWDRQSLRIAVTHREVLEMPDMDVESAEGLGRRRVLH
jgi:hypothetical protein